MIFNLKIYKEKMNTSVTAVCIVFSLQRVYCVKIKLKFPLSSGVWTSAFAQCNPPRSLWLQLVHRTGCFTRRAHIAVPPLHFV